MKSYRFNIVIRVLNKSKKFKIFNKYANDPSIFVREHVANSKNCPISILEKLSKDDYFIVLEAVLKNPNCPFHILKENLYKKFKETYVNKHVKISIAKNKKCTIEILEELSESNFWEVRSCVASNKNTTISILNKLSSDKNLDVRISVCINENTTINILEKIFNSSLLFEDNCESENYVNANYVFYLHRQIIKNKNCPFHILKEVYKEHEDLRFLILKHHNWKFSDFI